MDFKKHGSGFIALFMVLFIALWSGLCAPARAAQVGVTDSQIIIGQTISYGENANPYAVAITKGIRLYIDQVNASGGVGGRKIVLKVMDDQAKADLAEANARALVKAGVFLLFAPLEGGPAVAVAKVAEESGVVLFAPLAGSPSLTQPTRPLVFQIRAPHSVEFVRLLTHAATNGYTRVAFFRADTEIGKAHAANMRAAAAQSSSEIVAELPYKENYTDEQIDDLVAKAKEVNAQVVINHGAPRLYERFILRSKAAGFTPKFLGVNSGSSEIAKRLGADARGLIFSQITPNPEGRNLPLVREFQKAWRAAYPGVPLSHGALEGFMSAKALVISLRRASNHLTTANFIAQLHANKIDLGGLKVTFSPADHAGLQFVDLSFVREDGSFAY